MALIDEVKTALRVSIDDDDINLQIQSLISAAKEDLVYTADVSDDLMEQEEIPALIKLAIISFVKANWSDNPDESDKLMNSYNSMKVKLSVSSYYGTYES